MQKSVILFLVAVSTVLTLKKSAHKNSGEINKNFEKNHDLVDPGCANPDILPQIDQIGQATDLLYLDKKENVFDFTCFSRKYSLDGTHQIPDGLGYRPLLEMITQNQTFMAQNLHEFQEIKIQTTRTIIGDVEYAPELNKVAGALNGNITKIERRINYDNVIFQKLTTSFAQSAGFILDYSQLSLSAAIKQAITELPNIYDEKKYRDFIKTYGTHFREKIRIGGLIEQVGFTNRSYTYTESLHETGQEFLKHFVQEELDRDLSVNHVPTALINEFPHQDYLDNTSFGNFFIKGGNYESLTGWVGSLEKKPVVIRQTLVNMTNIVTPDFFPNDKDIGQKRTNTERAIKAYLIESQGCTNPNAINYDKDALVNDNSCFFTVFDGSYQTANSQECTQDMTDSYQINNPKTNDVTCSTGSSPKKVAIYDYSGCQMVQYFCLRNDPLSDLYPDLYQSLQFCENRTVTDVFYSPSQQYKCDTNAYSQDSLFFNFKNNNSRQINTCLQNFCYNGNTQGIQKFVNRHKGACYGIETTAGAEDLFAQCSDGCLVLYGKVKIADDCDVQQFICIDQERDIECFNN